MPPPSDPPKTVDVLGVRFHNFTRREAAATLADMVRDGQKGYIVKPYSEFMPVAVNDERVRAFLNGASLCLSDGVGILWAAHYLSLPGGRVRALVQLPLSLLAVVINPNAVRRPLVENMAGPDLTMEMLRALNGIGARVYLLGGTKDEVAGARERIETEFPGLQVLGVRDGYFDTRSGENDAVVDAINTAAPQALFVAMGFPRQEEWIVDNLPHLNVNVVIAEGGSFSFLSGKVRRAPGWLRRSGLEWLFRLVRQPWRLRRQARLPQFVRLVVRERLSH